LFQVPTQESLQARRQSFQRHRNVSKDDAQSFQRHRNVTQDDVQIHIDGNDPDDIEILELYQQVFQ
jgi:hypothetical protein